ncbi:MAG: acyltransferase family protein [Acidimicrobiales bacterium]
MTTTDPRPMRAPETGPSVRHPREHPDGAPLLRHVPALDGLRGAAVAGVLLFHADLLLGGYLGVDLFFVLSGFLISSLLLAERREKGRIDRRRFWARRARRLLPALAGLLAGIVVFALVFADSNQLGQIRADGLATMLYVANWHAIFSKTGYWDLFVAPSPLEHMWSLAIEEQFYVIWPFVAYAALRTRRTATGGVPRGPRRLFVVSVVLALASLTTMVLLASPSTIERVYLGTDTRAASMLIGAALASWLAWRGPVRSAAGRVTVEVLGAIGLVVLAVAWVRVDGQTIGLYRGGLFLCGLSVAAVIAAVAHPRPGPLAAVMSLRPLRWLGMISYGLYLWHWPVFIVLDEQRVGLSRWPLFAVRLAVSLALALVSYYALELPIRQRRLPSWLAALPLRRAARAPVVPAPDERGPRESGKGRLGWLVATPLVAAALVAGLLVVTSGATTPAPLADTVTAVRASLDDVTPPPAVPEAGGPPRVLFAGDSVSYFLAQEVLAHQRDFGIVAANAALPGCRFTPGRIRRADGAVVEDTQWPMCDTLWAEAVDRVRPDLVFLTVADPGAVDREVERQWTTPCDERFDRYLRSKLTAAVDALSATGATVVLGTSVRAMPTYANGVIPDHLDCFNQTIRSVVASDPRTRLVDVDGFVCPDGTCTDEVDGRPLRLDGLHFVGPAADYVDGWLVPQIVAEAPSR